MKVFGIGLNKTGTTSLGKALEILGYKKHISCNWELTKLWSENNLNPILKEAEKYNNFEDWPWPLVYKELFKKFENAKFILTIRDTPEDWYSSLCNHALRTGPTEFRKRIYGYYMPHDFKSEHINFYNNHNKGVIRFFKKNAPEKLLVISFKDGNRWEKICDFLNNEIPETDFPFLNRNRVENQSSNKEKKDKKSITISNRHVVKFLTAGIKIKNTIHNILYK